MSKTAIILAGGRGERLKSYTKTLPKSLLPIHGYPILEIIIRNLVKKGFYRIILAVNHFADQIQAFCGSGSKWGVAIEYSYEEQPLGTIGPIKQIEHLPEDFLILNSDILTDFDYEMFFDYHVSNQSLLTIAHFEKYEELEYGILDIQNHHLIGFREKPILAYPINMGVYMAHRNILSFIPDQKFFGIDHLIQALLSAKQPIATLLHQGKWIDIGSIENYQDAPKIFHVGIL